MELKAQTRSIFGKSTKSLRRQAIVPAELYGHNIKNIHLQTSAGDLEKVFKVAGENQIINLVVDEKDKRLVLIHAFEKHHPRDEITSVDFYEVRADEKIRTRVPLDFTGEAPAVKNLGGILIKTMQDIEVEALPMEIPPKIEIKLGSLKEIGASIHVKDLSLDEKGTKIITDPRTVIATVVAQKVEKEAAPKPAEAAAETAPTPPAAGMTSPTTPKHKESPKTHPK